MMIRMVFSSVLVCSSLMFAACDDAADDKTDTRAEMDGGEEQPRDAGATDASRADGGGAARDGGRDATSSPSANDAAEDPYQCEAPPPPSGTIAAGQACCDGLGTCVAAGDAGSTLSIGDCNAAQGLRCMSKAASGDAGVGDAGATALTKCRYRSGTQDAGPDYEGRCVPECLTRGSTTLPQGECQNDFVCVPCYDLITGASTGACDNAGDRPIDPAPPGFAECGDTLGYCIPMSSVGPTGANLEQLTCDADERCAPKQRVEDADGCFARCDSLFGAGACLPAFLIPTESRGVLTTASCAAGELCSPCINPTTMMRTGACD